MKKLMIVAAVAAMAGAAVAVDGYDFTASVKTTKGKAGSQTTTYKVQLGRANDSGGVDGKGTYWWDGLGMGFTSDQEAKKYIGHLNNEEKKAFAEDLGMWDSTTSTFDESANPYPVAEKYNAKGEPTKWCYTFSFKDTAKDCYRVAGSRKLKGIVAIDDCCNTAWEFVSWNYDQFDLADIEFTTGIFYRFGGVKVEKASKVEYAGTIGQFDAATIGTWALAGQGTWDVKNDMLKNISGNIVGVLANPDCVDCCNYNASACFFGCDETQYSDKDSSISGTEGTAAFGTWSIKYNKRY